MSQAQQYLCPALRGPGAPSRFVAESQAAEALSQLCAAAAPAHRALVLLDDDPAWHNIRVFRFHAHDLDDDDVAMHQLAGPAPDSALASTTVLGPFPLPVNGAEPSPDGNWLAVLSDTMAVTLLPEALDYNVCAGLMLKLDSRLRRCGAVQS